MVKSEKVYSAQNYIEAVTGKYFINQSDNDIEHIQDILADEGFENIWNYPLSEIEHIVENDINVVIVECMCWNNEEREFEYVYRWFEVPEDFKEE